MSNKAHLHALLAKWKAEKAAQLAAAAPPPADPVLESIPSTELREEILPTPTEVAEQNLAHTLDKYGNVITLNEKQLEFVRLATSGQSCVLIGAAGTGKSTCQRAVTQALIASGRIPRHRDPEHKNLPKDIHGIVICAYTRRATANIAANVSEDLQANCVTVHKVLEFAPEYYEIKDPETGEFRTTMRFTPSRTQAHPLDSSLKTIIVEEASMLGTDLFRQLKNAIRHEVQFIFLGDIQQLPPTFGPAILGFALNKLPVVELTEVYRQALDSPIIALAHRILAGRVLSAAEFPEINRPGKLTMKAWKKKIDSHDALATARQFFQAARKAGQYVAGTDMILMTQNVKFGTIEMNKLIANDLAMENDSEVFEIVAGFQKVYYRVGEKVLYEKEDAEIIDISPNPAYSGAQYQPASKDLDYWGSRRGAEHGTEDSKETDEDVDLFLSNVVSADSEDRVRQASHTIKLRMTADGEEVDISSAGDINALLYGYALTVHKAQGSEWRRVFILVHHSNNRMLSREILYTAVTRAREELVVICENDTFIRGITNQRIAGETLEQKAEEFKGKLKEGEDYTTLI